MKVLIIGSGGRENAIAWKISQSPLLTKLFCAPGNPGTASVATNISIDILNFESIKHCVIENDINMVVVGPEEPLVRGLGDYFRQDAQLGEILFVGPDSSGAALEGSKEFAKAFMKKHNIPTASYNSFNKNTINEAFSFLESLSPPYVLKADGLAAGKGVIIPETLGQAKEELREMLGGKFGKAGETVVIEEFLHGIELSVFIMTDGKEYLILPEAKDYKRIYDGDKGLNTGGMGAVSPVPFATDDFMQKVESQVIIPTIHGLQKDNIHYKGFIFIGLMNCNGSPYVIEYNVRLGDPETEAILPRIESDLLEHLKALGQEKLSSQKIKISSDHSLTVVMVSEGYPQNYEKGIEITLDNSYPDKMLFHAGTATKENRLITAGGRVFALTVTGSGISECRQTVYNQIEDINYKGKFFRKDIGTDLL